MRTSLFWNSWRNLAPIYENRTPNSWKNLWLKDHWLREWMFVLLGLIEELRMSEPIFTPPVLYLDWQRIFVIYGSYQLIRLDYGRLIKQHVHGPKANKLRVKDCYDG